MKRLFTLIAVVIAITGCGDNQPPAAAAEAQIAPSPDHNYVMQDGMQYGYPAAISEDQRKAGQVAQQIVMIYYAGERDGKLQAHILNGGTVTALECERPCNYLKTMTYIDSDYLRDKIHVERMVMAATSLGAQIMQDAMHGKLKQYGRKQNGKPVGQWVDEQRGMISFPMPAKS